MTEQKKHKHCLICGSERLKHLKSYSEAHLVQCKSCNFVFSEFIPSEQELIEYYEGYGRNDYLSPITIKRYHELLDKFEPYKKTGRILDVGCGIGYFLEEAKKRGWEVYGTEYTQEAIDICEQKGINMQSGALNPSNYELESFDIITSFEVIEHINNPREELGYFNQLLRKGGLVYVTTPNFNSLLRYRLKSKYNVITYPEHLSYYTKNTLKNAFNLSGFQSKKILTTGISLTRLRTSKGTSEQAFISESSDDEKFRNKIEEKSHLQILKNAVNWILSVFGIGDSLKGYFLKK